MALQHKRSSIASKRPVATSLSDGQLAINVNASSPGVFFKNSSNVLTKVGPVHIGTSAPNSSPATGGSTGNSIGEQWLDTTGGTYVLKIWDGSAWRSESGTFVDVSGDTMTGALILPSGTASAPALGVGSSDNGLYLPATDELGISTNGSERLRIDSSGRLLVGTSSASIGQSSTLSVNSTSAANVLSIARQNNDIAGPRLILTKTRGSITTSVNNNDTLGEIRFAGSDGVDVASNAAIIAAQVDGTPGSNDMPGRLVFSTTADGASSPTERLRIDSSGNVGIGTSSPDVSLHVKSDSGVKIHASSANTTAVLELAGTRSLNAVAVAISKIKSIPENPTGNSDDTSLAFETRSQSDGMVERMRIDSSGRVGIGLTSASTALHVKSTSATQLTLERDGSGDQISGIIFKDGSGDQNRISSSDSNLLFETGASNTERMRIDSSGRLLVGTSSTSESARAILQGNSYSSTGGCILKLSRGSANPNDGGDLGNLQFTDSNHGFAANISAKRDGGTWTSGSSQPTRLEFSTTADGASSPTERLRIDSSGNVGIGGITTPTHLLHIGSGTNSLGTTAGNELLNLRIQSDTTNEDHLDFTARRVSAGTTWVSAAQRIQRKVDATPMGYIQLGNHDSDLITFGRNNTEYARLDNSGNVELMQGKNLTWVYAGGSTHRARIRAESSDTLIFENGSGNSERMRIDSSGNVGIGTTSPRSFAGFTSIGLNGTSGCFLDLFRNGTREGSVATDSGGFKLEAVGSSTPLIGITNGAERMRIDSSGNLSVGTTSVAPGDNNNNTGISLNSNGRFYASGAGDHNLNKTADGVILAFRSAGVNEGAVSISGTTVTYGGGHLARWSQLLDNADPSGILKGTVMSNLDEMCDWGEEDNEQLNRTKISDIEGDSNVAGVFVSTSFNDEGPFDFYVGMTGDMVIRIAQGTTVERGDLLMSAGDGTAKPQDDDIIRSKTIAKVISTNVSETYADGSYCVPCVLMAC